MVTWYLVSESALSHVRSTRDADSRSLGSVTYGMTIEMTSSAFQGVDLLSFLVSGSSIVVGLKIRLVSSSNGLKSRTVKGGGRDSSKQGHASEEESGRGINIRESLLCLFVVNIFFILFLGSQNNV
ncbi:hypothetical protein BRARA_D02420 [Brassica rapa]|uniref:Uncharacterized protein n=1 Tax=Brassica campestris TaxID=3711 RepID=A0A397ZWQ9_BRACM|nr:hypothetical protein BRARA_D02420 [Brassica rapa]